MKGPSVTEKEHRNFIENIIVEDLESGKHKNIVTRFPPEPNGYLHLGHGKSITLNFGLARDNSNTICHLRFDDTNPEKEDTEYVNSIKEDIKWLGFDWGENIFFSSDYFEKLYTFAIELIEKGLAFIDEQSADDIRAQRGTLKEVGTNSPHRMRSKEESMNLFAEMREGKHADGKMVLRAKIDMQSPNINMRDPIIYRIRHVEHHRTGNDWCIYPMYDFTHCLSDALEKISHSLCTLEFQDHRPLYDWCLENTTVPAAPRQIEFAKMNLNYLIMSKRNLLRLVNEKLVDGWDDPRMPTLSGVRRRGYTPEGLRSFYEFIGVGKKETVIDYSILEDHIRNDLNKKTKRAMAVIDPLKVTITNWPKGGVVEEIDAPFHPKDESFGTRNLNLGRVIYVDRADFMEDPPSPKKWFRLGPGRMVRLRYGCIIQCDEVIIDKNNGKVKELKASFIDGTFHGKLPEGMKKVKGIIHWVNAEDAVKTEIRLYDRMVKVEKPNADNFIENLNENSLVIKKGYVEPYIANANPGDQFQFERVGYFTADTKLSKPGALIYNRTVTLRDSWPKED
jgi:glutaminyl-tRNA synthetase